MNEHHHQELHDALDKMHDNFSAALNLASAADQRMGYANRLISIANRKMAAAKQITHCATMDMIECKEACKREAEERNSSSEITKLEKRNEELADSFRIANMKAREWELKAEDAMREAASWKRLAEPKKKAKQKKQCVSSV